MTYFVYVLHSPTFNKIYVGFTSNLEQRLLSHNQLATKGWTVKFRPWKLVHLENFQSKTQAVTREKQLKSARGRESIWNLVNNSDQNASIG
jgi:putative endonuclease